MARSDFWMLERIRVRFTEVDVQGIVQNGAYLTYFSVALNEYFRHLPFDRVAEDARAEAGLHVVHAEIDYLAPLRFDEIFEIGARVSRLGRSSFTLSYEIFRADSEESVARGHQIWVNTSQVTRKAIPLADAFRERVTAREGDRVDIA